jgi:hypothetical protein
MPLFGGGSKKPAYDLDPAHIAALEARNNAAVDLAG